MELSILKLSTILSFNLFFNTPTIFNLDLNRVNDLPIIALDTGGIIKGNRIDILFDNKQEAINFGKQIIKVRIIKKEDI